MRTTITRAQLAKAMGAIGGLPTKDLLSPFSKVRLDAAGPSVSLSGSDGNVQVEYRVLGETATSGMVLVPGKLLQRFVAAMPEGDVKIAEEARKKTSLEGNGVKFHIKSFDKAEYAVMAGPKGGTGGFDIESVVLREMLRKVKFAVCRNETRRALCGVNVVLKEWRLEMTATDGRVLAHVEKDLQERGNTLKGEPPRFNITLPNKTVDELFGLLGDEDGYVTVQSDGKAVRFTADAWCMTAKVVDERFPGWEKVVPEKTEHEAKINRKSFLDALGRAVLAADEECRVDVTLSDGHVKFDASNDISKATAEIYHCGVVDGARETFMFNAQLLKNVLEAVDDDWFTLGWNEASSAVVLRCSIPWMAVVMPLRRKEG